MNETSFQKILDTTATPRIDESRLTKAVTGTSEPYDANIDEARPSESYVIRARNHQTTVIFKLNTKRLLERREIERANDAQRRLGG